MMMETYQVRVLARNILVLRCHGDLTGILDQLLDSIDHELVEGIDLLPH